MEISSVIENDAMMKRAIEFADKNEGTQEIWAWNSVVEFAASEVELIKAQLSNAEQIIDVCTDDERWQGFDGPSHALTNLREFAKAYRRKYAICKNTPDCDCPACTQEREFDDELAALDSLNENDTYGDE